MNDKFLIRSTLVTVRNYKTVKYPNGLHYRDEDNTTIRRWYVAEKIGTNFYDRQGFYDTEQLAIDSTK